MSKERRSRRAYVRLPQTLRDSSVAIGSALLLLVLGYLLGFVETSSALAAVGLVAAVATACGIGAYLATRAMAEGAQQVMSEVQDQVFSAIVGGSTPTITQPVSASPTFRVISSDEVATLERNCKEMWCYAYDMRWDYERTEFDDLVRTNLESGKRYRYLIPPTVEVISRAKGILCRYQDIENIVELLQFRMRKQEAPFAQFGITIYNPTFMKTATRGKSAAVVLFPHFGRRPIDTDPFVNITGEYASDYERKFAELWLDADKLDGEQALRECDSD